MLWLNKTKIMGGSEGTKMKSKILLAIGTIIVMGSVSTACEVTKTNEKVKSSPKVETVKNVADPNKEWEDLSMNSDGAAVNFPTNAKDWIAYQVDKISQPDPKGADANFDEGYDYYLKAKSVLDVMGRYIRVKGTDLEKDFKNLRGLAGEIYHEQFNRTAHIDPEGKAMEKTEFVGQWKPTSKSMRKTYEYMTRLLNDMNVAINNDGKGKTFGVSHQLNGEATNEMESYISHHDEDGKTIK
ncbi:hypothetical protein [Bacillus pseudomycoides]|uniref:hypothetical protein n=2 Tax=Bacillus TaxID=1386 RepID=UPI00032FA87B|nr:hypothetical protein IIW_05286 [Bacillus cereus VD136]EOQ10148.1 hypothetical protein KOY_05510 [Bacillus cereus VDM021]